MTALSSDYTTAREGCLSVSKASKRMLLRRKLIAVVYINIVKTDGLLATCCQHELDIAVQLITDAIGVGQKELSLNSLVEAYLSANDGSITSAPRCCHLALRPNQRRRVMPHPIDDGPTGMPSVRAINLAEANASRSLTLHT